MIPLEDVPRLGGVLIDFEVRLDCGSLPFRQLLMIRKGSVIPSTRPAGDNIDIHIGGRLLGYGEIVAIQENRGIRVTNMKELE